MRNCATSVQVEVDGAVRWRHVLGFKADAASGRVTPHGAAPELPAELPGEVTGEAGCGKALALAVLRQPGRPDDAHPRCGSHTWHALHIVGCPPTLVAHTPGQAEIILEAREAVGPGLTDTGTRGITLADAALVGGVAARGARRGRIVCMLAVSTPVAEIGRAWVTVVGTTTLARLDTTRRGAAVAVYAGTIVTFF